MEFIDKKINEKLNKELGIPTLVKSFMGKSVVESTLNRVKKHLDSEKGFFIISTHLPNMDEETEVKRAKSLVEELKQRGLGYIPLRGKYTREDTGEIEYEHSFFIPNTGMGDFKGIAKELCKNYGQESVVFAEKGKAYFLDSNGSMSLLGESVGEVEELNQFWSRLKKGRDKKRFWAFESLYPMSNFALNAAHNWGELF